MFQFSTVGLPHNGEHESRAIVAVAFAWEWQQFPITTDGESRPGHILFKCEPEQASAFHNEFIPALNQELKNFGFDEVCTYGTGNWYYDLDDPEDLPGMTDLIKELREKGSTLTFADYRAIGRVELAKQLKAKIGSRYYKFERGMRLVSIRNSEGRLVG